MVSLSRNHNVLHIRYAPLSFVQRTQLDPGWYLGIALLTDPSHYSVQVKVSSWDCTLQIVVFHKVPLTKYAKSVGTQSLAKVKPDVLCLFCGLPAHVLLGTLPINPPVQSHEWSTLCRHCFTLEDFLIFCIKTKSMCVRLGQESSVFLWDRLLPGWRWCDSSSASSVTEVSYCFKLQTENYWCVQVKRD